MLVEKKIEELKINPYTLFSKEWGLLSSGNKTDDYNAMTIAWGTLGALWERKSHSNRLPVATVYVRPNRYTNQFMEKEEYFSIAFINNKKVLGYMGSHSGKDVNKYQECNLTPVFDSDTVYPEGSELVFICKKLYTDELKEEEFNDHELVDFNYPDRDFHNQYVGEIVKILVNE